MSKTSVLPDVAESVGVLPPYNIIVFNDDYHTFEFVIMVLCEVFGYKPHKSFGYAQEIHESGRAIVWSGGQELGELKLEQLLSFREGSFGSLHAVLEPSI
jgi:ATP-dependent Clp protease adaptor protein ClpS